MPPQTVDDARGRVVREVGDESVVIMRGDRAAARYAFLT
jgi:hypothetical protein